MKNNFKKYLILLLLYGSVLNAMKNKKDYYSLLNVSPDAKQEEITQSFNEIYKTAYPSIVKEEAQDHSPERKEFKKRVYAYLTLSNPELRKNYNDNPMTFEKPFDFYNHLGVSLKIEQNGFANNRIPFETISPENAHRFFTEIPLYTISKALRETKDDQSLYYYDILSDKGLRSLYHQNPTISAFNNALKTYDPTLNVEPEPAEESKFKKFLKKSHLPRRKSFSDKANKALTLVQKLPGLKRTSTTRSGTLN